MTVDSDEKIMSFPDEGFWDDQKKREELLEDFWENSKSQLPEVPNLDGILEDFQKEIYHLKNAFSSFKDKLRSIPMLVAFGYWIKAISYETETAKRHVENLQILFDENILLVSQNDRVITLKDLDFISHQSIIEEIRCIKTLTVLQKEDVVKSYVSFSHFLARSIFNIIPHGWDPDREKARDKEIKYETFLDFVQNLPKRDALIAKLLYFGAPSIEEILSLKPEQIDSNPNLNQVHFNKTIELPKHVIKAMQEFVKSHRLGLVFPNAKGKSVERAHLNQSFARASKKTGTKITPASLLKWKSSRDTGGTVIP